VINRSIVCGHRRGEIYFYSLNFQNNLEATELLLGGWLRENTMFSKSASEVNTLDPMAQV
jgi:hypothetical protein